MRGLSSHATRRAAAACFAAALYVGTALPAAADAGFQRWIAGFEETAVKSGVSRQVYRAAFAGISDPDPEVLEKARFQPEFQDKIWDYMDNRVHEESIAEGQAYRAKLKPVLDRIERRFGVDRDVLLAIWSMESNYGRILTRTDVVRSVPRSLATLAYLDKKRAKFARSQLIAALKIVQDGDVSVQGLTGSWAGAMGHTQFIPTSYRLYRADMDGNGHADIWTSVPDALATAANLLAKNGWQTGRTWGYEVVLPSEKVAALAGSKKTVGQWAKLGVRRVGGRDFSSPGENANLVLPAGPNGPAFLMTKNFYVLKAYNNADKYALAVGHLSDRIGGAGEFAQDWPRGYKRLNMEERYEVQQRLTHHGLYDGKIDGKIGEGSKIAIMSYQKRAGVDADGNASKALLDLLRRN
ncbi:MULTISPECIES: lytic murein transglycosylase [unclassified Aureimonas]|uniref:lytic murein transglycosylase n=1 Tax=unclassified Aureimonas TaxID=2615206 RepID=UPI0006F7072C|nr:MULTISPECIES: lytic murein transglycosylase [unclassified Aureimonas]KQT52119.1 lytic transglycosylase [Aureimonas sp. Leaf427]KQT70647.1 lytic transglycosylase [Aureimonas sp. Leaf460]